MLFTFMEVFQLSREIDNQPTGEKDLVLRSMRKRNYYIYKEKILPDFFHRMAKTAIERKAVDLVYHTFGLKHIISLSSEQELQWLKNSHAERIQMSLNTSSPGIENEIKDI